jgi:hypothetical protein
MRSQGDIHDEDPGNAAEQPENGRIFAVLPDGGTELHLVCPDLEGLLGYQAPKRTSPLGPYLTSKGFILRVNGPRKVASSPAPLPYRYDERRLYMPTNRRTSV